MLAACHIATALQSIVARTLPPYRTAVISVTQIAGGNAYNVIPERARLGGTARAMERETLTAIEAAIRRIATGVALGLGASAEIDFRLIFAPLLNDAQAAREYADAAAELVEEANVDRNKPPVSASEDFAFMLERVPGAYISLGNGESSAPLHTPGYDFNDEALPFGAALYARIVERQLGRMRGA